MLYILFQLLLCVVSGATTTGVIVKFEVKLPYSLVVSFGKENAVAMIEAQIPEVFPSIQADNILSVNIASADDNSELIVELDPDTPELDYVIDEAERFIDSGVTISAGGLLITTVPDSLVIVNPKNGTVQTVSFICMLPWAAIPIVGEAAVIDGLKTYTPDYISISKESIKDVKIEDVNGFIGVHMKLPYNLYNIKEVLLEAKAFVDCGTVIVVPNQPQIKIDPLSFNVTFPEGEKKIITGDEKVLCDGQTADQVTTTSATTTTLRPRPTRKIPSTSASPRMDVHLPSIMVAVVIASLVFMCEYEN